MKIIAMILILGFAAPLALTACDRTVETQKKTTTDENGNAKVEKKTETVTPNGDHTVTQEKKTVEENH